jgi:glycosyltransferase involved in cell wall biosynthesis
VPARRPTEPTPRRLRVLHVSVPTNDGVANVALGYLRDQVERGWHVTVACPSEGYLGFEARSLGASVRWWRASPGGLSGLAGEVSRLGRIVEDTAPDVVHLHSARAGMAGRLLLRDRVSTVYQPHAWSFLTATRSVRRGPLRWERYAARWTSELVCVSESERLVAEGLGVQAPTTVLPNGVDVSVFLPQGERDRVAARKALGLDDVPTVVCIGALRLQKGQQDLLADWPEIRAQVPEAQLVLIGDGPDRHSLARQAASLEGVQLVGWRSDIPTWLAATDVVAVPSRWEGMALVPLEAMASARSVVATDVTGVVDSVPPNAGAVVPAGDGPAFVKALVRRLVDPTLAEDEGWNGRSHVERNHDAARSARELSRVYLRLVGARRSR